MRVRHSVHPGQHQFYARRILHRLTVTVVVIAATVALTSGPANAEQYPDALPTNGTKVRVVVGPNPARVVTTHAVTPTGVLSAAGVTLTPHDEVLLVRQGRRIQTAPRKVRTADTVRVVRVGKHVKIAHTPIKQRTISRTTHKLSPGQRKVVTNGRRGVRKIRIVHWTRNGHRAGTDVTRYVVKVPVPRRILIGAKVRTVPGTANLNWRALANCESSGNPRAVNPAGYYGLYQFSVPTWRGVRGRGMPHHASAAEQTYRAQKLYAQSGRSPWPTCGRLL